ncbi:MAG: tail fiber domain-containing protein [Candidatus Sungbacteria bacterium]|uniref:Tail fiber domain-containing protein n=1 Tax=Candidatus Sungiibacteriota bacterium TaxID=2750080 RepID=A0A9D6DR44_9BACT|nr:tail fiber domain-containing protein [Candidatus Sungbacteria bacterium]
MGIKGEMGKKERGLLQWAETALVSILVLAFVLGGFNLKFANALYGAVKEFIQDATTLQGHTPGTHANDILLLDKEGKISIYGHIETQGQFRSYVKDGIAPIVVDSKTTVENLSADYLDNLSAQEFTLQFVTKNGPVTYDNVKLEGGAEIGSLLKVKAPAQFLDYISVAKNLSVGESVSVGKDLVVNGISTLAGKVQALAGILIAGRVDVKGDIDATGFIAAQRGQIKEGGLSVSGNTQLNTLGVTGGASMSDLGISGNFSVAGKEISLGDSGADKMTVTASSTFKGPFEVVGYEAKFGRGLEVLANGLTVAGVSSITGNLTVTGDTTITGNLALGGSSSGGTGLGIGTSTPGAALGVKGAGLFEGFVSADYFTSTSSLTSWIMGQFGIGTTTPGSQLAVKGAGLYEGFVSADYFTSTSTNTSWLMGQMGIGTTTPGAQMGINGAGLFEGFVSADYFTSTSTNSSWLLGRLGIGTTTPGNFLDVNGSGNFDSLYVQATSTVSSLIATSTLEVRGQSGNDFVVTDGNVGVGTSTPGASFSSANPILVGGTGTSTVEDSLHVKNYLRIGAASGYIADNYIQFTSVSSIDVSDTSLNIDSDTLYIDAANNRIGLGRTSPDNLLDVMGSGQFSNDLSVIGGDLNLGGASGVGKATSTLTSLGGRLAIYDNAQASTTPGAIFSIHGSTTTPMFLLNNTSTGDLMLLQRSGITAFMIGNGDNVGIGTSTPGTRLAVRGDSDIKGNEYVQGTSTMSSLIATSTLEVRSTAYTGGSLFNTFKEKIGMGTSTPGSLLAVHGAGNIGELTVEGPFKASYITATSTTNNTFSGALDVTESATSTFTGGVNVSTTGGLSSATGLTITGGDILSSGKLTLTGASTSTAPQLNVSTILTTPILDVSTIIKNSGTATSTFAGGLSVATGGLLVSGGGINVDVGDVNIDQKLVVNGNVGIGTTEPSVPLEVNGAYVGSGFGQLRINGNNGTDHAYLSLNAATAKEAGIAFHKAGTINWGIWDSATSNDLTFFDYNGTPGTRMIIKSGGNVGIGRTGPSQLLDVMGSAQFSNDLSVIGGDLNLGGASGVGKATSTLTSLGGRLAIYDNSQASTSPGAILSIHANTTTPAFLLNQAGAGDLMEVQDNGTTVFKVQDGGNVGIGTTRPSLSSVANAPVLSIVTGTSGQTLAGLELAGNSQATVADESIAAILFLDQRSTDSTKRRAQIVASEVSNDAKAGRLEFWTHNGTSLTQQVTIDSSGNVGIGRTGPSQLLDVMGSAQFSNDLSVIGGDLNLGGASGVGKATSTLTSLGGRLAIYDNSQASTSPGAIFSIHANTTTPAFLLNQAGAGDLMEVQDNGTTVFKVQDGGNVGIGTTAPGAKLDITIPSLSTTQAGLQLGIPFTAIDQNSSAIFLSGVQNNNQTATIGFGNSASTDTNAAIAFNSVSGWRSNIDFYVNNAGAIKTMAQVLTAGPAMRIQNDGNVGIGRTGPSQLLDVMGSGQFSNDLSVIGGDLNLGGASGVGKATSTLTSLGGRLAIYDNSQASTSPGAILSIHANTTTPAFLLNQAGAGDLMEVQDNGTTVFKVQDGGNVGIGTTGPTNALEIVRSSGNTILAISNSAGGAEAQMSLTNTGTADNSISRFIATVQSGATAGSDPFIDFSVSGGDRYVVGIDNSDSDKFGIWENSNPGTNPRLIIDTSGNVGIGTTEPVSTLNIQSASPYVIAGQSQDGVTSGMNLGLFGGHSNDGSTNSKGGIGYVGWIAEQTYNTGYTPSAMVFYTHPDVANNNTALGAATEKMRITSGGKVGIGDADPTEATLVVGAAGAGDIYATFATANTEALCWDASGASLITDCTSLSQYKENVANLSLGGLDTVMRLTPREYDWIGKEAGIKHDLGFVAEEVNAVNPLLASYNYDENGVLVLNGVKYDRMTALLAKAIQDIGYRISLTSAPTTTPSIMVDASGNVGIGSTTPSYKLAVAGDVAATSFINISTRTAKKDIEYLDSEDEGSVLDKIKSTRVATYNYISDANIQMNANDTNSITNGKQRLGLIAEEAPVEVLSIDGKGVDIYKLSSFILAGVKAQQVQIDALTSRVSALEGAAPIGPIGPISPISPISPITTALKAVVSVAKATLATIASAMGDWANAVLADSTQLKTASEDSENVNYELNGVTSGREEIIASGSATLQAIQGLTSEGGQTLAGVKVRFDESFTSIISETEPIKVIVTPTTRLNGALYVHAKTRFGFEVREINAYDEGGMFDWMVVARKKGGEENGGNGTQGDEMAPAAQEIPVSSEPITPVETPSPPSEPISPVEIPVEPVPTEEVIPPPAEEPAPPVEEPVTPPVDSETSPPPVEEPAPPAEEPVTPPAP